MTRRPVKIKIKINDIAGTEGGGGCGCGGCWSECDHNEDVVGMYCARHTATPYLIYDIRLDVNCEYWCCLLYLYNMISSVLYFYRDILLVEKREAPITSLNTCEDKRDKNIIISFMCLKARIGLDCFMRVDNYC